MWKLAWRNLWRNRSRTVILLTAIALPYAAMIVSFGFIGDFLSKMEERSAKGAGGTVLVHGDGYWQAKSNDIVVDDAEAVRRRVAEAEGVREVIPRVVIRGMMSSSRGNAGVQITGVRPDRQAHLRDFSEHVTEGVYLSGEHDQPVVLGAGLVDRLGVELGDKVVLTASNLEGEMTRALFRLRGVVETGSEQIDDHLALTNVEAAREAIGMDDQYHQIGVLAADGVASTEVAGAVRRAIGERGEALEVLTWQEAMPEMVSYLAIERGGMTVMLIVIFVIVAFVMANTFLMSVMERVREFGLFSALGLNHWRIGKLVFAETLVLTVMAVIVGLVLGLSGHYAIDYYGIDFTQMIEGEMQISGLALTDMVMRSEFVPVKWFWGTVGVVVLVFSSAAYPAWKAMKLAPTEAMEFYEQ